ncbi:MAG: hypothetical protein CMC55_01490 [Flavobacteriaceae bacterium]|nr:hypothetical protein [Flavobacteriaceae bacterium]|tara:strand:+ start:80 stop:1240 length:1161 start_codon:yes stop_codon:yes gene_type:complete
MSHNVSLFIDKHISKNSDYILSLILILFFFVEFYSKICEIQFNFYPFQLSRIIKGIITVFLLVMLFLSKNYKQILILGLITSVFCIGQFSLDEGYSSDAIMVFFRYLFPLLLFLFYNSFRTSKSTSYFTKIFEFIVLLNSALIIIGLLFNIKLFETYNFSRFGYNGLIYASATSSYLYLIALFYFVVKWHTQNRLDLKFFIILIAACLIGTKSIYITLIMFLFYFIFKLKTKYKMLLSALLALITAFSAYFLIFESETFSKITSKNGILTAILSYRNEIFTNNMLPFISNEWNFVNYLFGGFSDFELRSQMGLIDLYFVFGGIGCILYLWYYFKLYITFKLTIVTRLFLIILIFMIFISGNFFLYSITSLFLIAYKENVLSAIVKK